MAIHKNIAGKYNTLKKLVENNLIQKGVFPKKTEKHLTVVMYHGIDQTENTRFNPRFFSVDNFEQQIKLFGKYYNILTHEDFMNGNYSNSKPNMVITFDDGYENNYKYALPILEKHKTHAYFFITGGDTLATKVLYTDAIDIVSVEAAEGSSVVLNGITFTLKNRSFHNENLNLNVKNYLKKSRVSDNSEKVVLIEQLLQLFDFTQEKEYQDYYKLMTAQQIAETEKSKYVTIGSHGFYHNNLGSLEQQDAHSEVLNSKEYLENIIGKTVDVIAFPDGSYTEQLNDSLYDAGFTKQFLVEYKYNDENKRDFVLDREGLYPYMGNANTILHKLMS